MSTTVPLADHPAIQQLSSAASLEARRAALSRLVEDYPGKTLAAEESIRKAFVGLGDEKASPEDRLANVAFMLAFVSKAREFRKLSEGPLRRLLVGAPAPMGSIEDAKSQLTLAAFLAQKRLPWLAEYLSSEAVRVEIHEKSRAAAVLGVFRNSTTWTDALSLLHAALRSVLKRPGIADHDAMKVVHGVLVASRTSIEKTPVEGGAALASTLASLIEETRSVQLAGERDLGLRVLVGAEVAGIANTVTALQPAYLADRALFAAVVQAKGLAAQGKTSPLFVKHALALMTRLKNAISLCVRHGIADVDVFSNLEKIAGSREAALKYTKAIARERQIPSAAVQSWLVEGELFEDKSDALSETDDHAIGVLMLRAKEYQANRDRGTSQQVAAALAVEAVAVARRRRLEMVGAPGDVVDYDPVSHRLTGEAKSVGGKVTIVVPAIVKNREHGGSTVVVPAVVRRS